MMAKKEYKVRDTVTIYNARLMWRNFSGNEAEKNPKGNRNFCIFLEDDTAKEMESDGWYVRWLQPRDEGDKPQGVLSVKVAFGNYPPLLVIISDGRQTKLNEDTVSMLDWAEIETCDVVLTPYNYNVSGRSGVKAYVKALYATLKVDDLAKKYNYHEGADEAIGGCGECETCDGSCGKPSAL
jgi:hypothetical protein